MSWLASEILLWCRTCTPNSHNPQLLTEQSQKSPTVLSCTDSLSDLFDTKSLTSQDPPRFPSQICHRHCCCRPCLLALGFRLAGSPELCSGVGPGRPAVPGRGEAAPGLWLWGRRIHLCGPLCACEVRVSLSVVRSSDVLEYVGGMRFVCKVHVCTQGYDDDSFKRAKAKNETEKERIWESSAQDLQRLIAWKASSKTSQASPGHQLKTAYSPRLQSGQPQTP